MQINIYNNNLTNKIYQILILKKMKNTSTKGILEI